MTISAQHSSSRCLSKAGDCAASLTPSELLVNQDLSLGRSAKRVPPQRAAAENSEFGDDPFERPRILCPNSMDADSSPGVGPAIVAKNPESRCDMTPSVCSRPADRLHLPIDVAADLRLASTCRFTDIPRRRCQRSREAAVDFQPMLFVARGAWRYAPYFASPAPQGSRTLY
jgi:hypothetical protein